MDNLMFCYQCQETAGGKGCTHAGICGKSPAVSNLQDRLIHATKVLSQITTNFREHHKQVPESANSLIVFNLFITITNTNFDKDVINRQLLQTLQMCSNLNDKAAPSDYRITDESSSILATKDEEIRSIRSMVLFGIKGMAAYIYHANALGYKDESLNAFIQRALAATLDDSILVEDLFPLVLEVGKYGIEAMKLLDRANVHTFGNPQPTQINRDTDDRPAILVSGHDFKDLKDLLDQTQAAGVDVYTHGEMLPAHTYPAFKKYPHLIGNYGNAWHDQKNDFKRFNGPILMTSNCLVPPDISYEHRLFTTGPVCMPGVSYISPKCNGDKDFSKIIRLAKQCLPPEQIGIDKGTTTGGFAHDFISKNADFIVSAIKAGEIQSFMVMAGCDGRMPRRSYYTDFARNLPEKCVILTAGCAKYRYNALDLGSIAGIPRVLDAGQCNDSYSLIKTAMLLKDALSMNDINDLPLYFNIAWYEQKAVLVLLTLLYLGFKNIHLGPTLPAFLSPNIADALTDIFGIKEITTVEDDLQIFFSPYSK